MPKRKTPVERPEDQFKRFVETAEKIGMDEKVAQHAFDAVAKPKTDKPKKDQGAQ
jgi:hypothetical protein